MNRIRSGGRAAMTLVELAISTTLIGIILSAIGLTVLTGKENFRQGMTAAALEVRASRALDRIVTELQGAGGLALSPDPVPPLGSSSLEFSVCTGYVGGARQWTPLIRIQRVDDPLDPPDGLDNDSDGTIDEGRVVLVRDAGGLNELQVTIVSGVRRFLQGELPNLVDDNGNGLDDEGGLSFVVNDDRTLTIRLTLEARDPRGQPLVRTVQTSVHMRN